MRAKQAASVPQRRHGARDTCSCRAAEGATDVHRLAAGPEKRFTEPCSGSHDSPCRGAIPLVQSPHATGSDAANHGIGRLAVQTS